MILNEFLEASKRTMRYGGDPKNEEEWKLMLGEYSMGLIGEVVELIEAYKFNVYSPNIINDLIEELGDVAHYTCGLYAMAGIVLPVTFIKERFTINEALDNMLYAAKNVSEYANKHIYHGHLKTYDFEESLGLILSCVNHVAYKLFRDLSIVLESNVNKLKTRYPIGFSSEASVERVDVL